jgi:hypothetical protein
MYIDVACDAKCGDINTNKLTPRFGLDLTQ